MDSIIQFLREDTLPEERIEADKVRRKATRFWLSENQKLYKRSFLGPYLLCIHPEMTESLLEELHEGICGSQYHPRLLVAKYVEGSSRIHQEVRLVLTVCAKHTSNRLNS